MATSNEIGAFEARTRLGELLRRVAAGERFVITNRGAAVAELVPATQGTPALARAAVDAMQRVPRVQGVSTAALLEMISAGRRS